MTVIALKSRALPNYTKSEEIVNSASHAVGVVFGIFVLIIHRTLQAEQEA